MMPAQRSVTPSMTSFQSVRYGAKSSAAKAASDNATSHDASPGPPTWVSRYVHSNEFPTGVIVETVDPSCSRLTIWNDGAYPVYATAGASKPGSVTIVASAT